jgi:hypothetical protein
MNNQVLFIIGICINENRNKVEKRKERRQSEYKKAREKKRAAPI